MLWRTPWRASVLQVRRQRSPYHHAGVFLSGMLALILVTTIYVVLETRAKIWDEAREAALSIALGLESTSAAVLKQPIVSMQGVAREFANGERTEARAREALAHALQFDVTTVFMGIGIPGGLFAVAVRDGQAASREVAEALRVRLQEPPPKGLGIQQLIHVPGRREWFMPIALDAADDSGAFVFALISARDLVAGADSLRLLPQSYVAFAGTDGRRLLRYWQHTDAVEANGPALPDERLDVMRGDGSGSFEVANSITGESQIVGYAHSTVLPMYVGTVVPTRGLYARWLRESTGPVLVLLMGTAALAAYALRLRRALRAEAEVRQQALTDKLTGLPNRRALDGDLRQAVALAARTGEKFSILMIDIDFFKALNDTYGHHMGDEVLRDFAVRLSAALRAQDRAYRYGGEEFCVLLPATDVPGTYVLAERVRQAVALPASPRLHAVTASLGAAVWQPGDDDALLLGRADEALYRAKAAGRNRVEFAGDPSPYELAPSC